MSHEMVAMHFVESDAVTTRSNNTRKIIQRGGDKDRNIYETLNTQEALHTCLPSFIVSIVSILKKGHRDITESEFHMVISTQSYHYHMEYIFNRNKTRNMKKIISIVAGISERHIQWT